MKQFLLTLSLTVMALAASAVPAKRGLTRTLTLADGTTVTAQLIGDEHGHYWLAPDGRAYQQLPNANFFAEVNPEAVAERANARRHRANARRSARLQQSQRVGEYGNYTGSKKGLIILVNYTDVTFRPANTPDLFDRIANEENFKKDRFVGSIHDYFYAQSEGVFDLTFDVVGPYTVSNTQAYYGGNDRQGNDLRPAEMVIEACQLADPDVNYPDYDWDGDGSGLRHLCRQWRGRQQRQQFHLATRVGPRLSCLLRRRIGHTDPRRRAHQHLCLRRRAQRQQCHLWHRNHVPRVQPLPRLP